MRVTAGLARIILVRAHDFKARSWSVSARGDAELLLEKPTEMRATLNPQSKQMSMMERCDWPGSRSSAAQWLSRLRQTYFQTEPAASAAKARCTLRTDVLQACAINTTERPGSARQNSIWRLIRAHWMSWSPSAGGASNCSRRASHVIAVMTFCKQLPLRPPRQFICLKASSSVDRRNFATFPLWNQIGGPLLARARQACWDR